MQEQEIYRHIMDVCDENLKEAFLRRMDASLHIAESKLQNGLPIYEKEQETEILAHMTGDLRSELSAKAAVLWKSLLRMSRGRQYRYLIDHDPSLILPHEKDLTDSFPEGVVLCPDELVRTVSASLDREIKPCPSIQTALGGVASGQETYAAIVVNSLYDTEWLYGMIADKPLYVDQITRANDDRLIVLLSRNLVRQQPLDPIVSIAFTVEHAHGSLAQALSILSDCRLFLEFMRLKKRKDQEDMIFLDFSGNLSTNDVRAALFQMQSELPFFRVLGFRESCD